MSVEKDLGVWVTTDLKPLERWIPVQSARKAQSVLGMVKRQFKELELCITLM